MKDYRRLKTDENSRLSLSWNLNREISKLNYRIHTDAIKENQQERMELLRQLAVHQLRTLETVGSASLPDLVKKQVP